MEVFEARLVEAVAARPEGETVLDAVLHVVLDGIPRLAEPCRAAVIAAAGRGARRAFAQLRDGLAGYAVRPRRRGRRERHPRRPTAPT
jgi:hypothetical protein